MTNNGSNYDSTKDMIISMALRLFQSKGYMKVSVKDICDACGITRGAFYYYYKTKDDILDDIYIISDYLSAQTISEIINSDNFIDQFYRLHYIYLKRTLEVGPEIMGQVLKRYIDKGTKLAEPKDVAVYEMYITLIKRAQETGQILNKAPARLLAENAIHLTNSIGLIWSSKKGEIDFSGELRRILDAVFMCN